MVPYQDNPRFIGRTRFLETMKERLSANVSRRYNYRIALYGMGGIGKTQCALGYVYANRTEYNRIYWINAVDQPSLLSGYQSIAKHARLGGLQSATPVEIARAVLSWLKGEQNWLLVVDNLDDIEVIGSLLPENGPEKHTLITTRDADTRSIPAEPLEVPLLEPEDAVDLLSALAEIDVPPGSKERKQAQEIVRELGYLPLAIEQASALVRAFGDFDTYSHEYRNNRRELRRVPEGNRGYSYWVATTWSLSFQVIQNEAPHVLKLLRLLSVLNPDGIVIEFLTSGAHILEDDLQQVVSSRFEMAKALLELEKFSLIRWDRTEARIIIHRSVQSVVKESMSEDEQDFYTNAGLALCDSAFPQHWDTEEMRRKFRRDVHEVCLLQFCNPTSQSEKLMNLLKRIGAFLYTGRKFSARRQILVCSW